MKEKEKMSREVEVRRGRKKEGEKGIQERRNERMEAGEKKITVKIHK